MTNAYQSEDRVPSKAAARPKADAKKSIFSRHMVRSTRNGALVKSAARVLAILEYFDHVQRPTTEREIAQMLELPQSSASALLHTMADLGYLQYDYQGRVYTISERVSLLGSWLESDVVNPGRIIRMMAHLRDKTQQSVALVRHHRAYVQYIHVINPAEPRAPIISNGTARPIASTVPGQVFLSSANDAEISRMIHRSNADAESSKQLVRPQVFREMLQKHREQGYAYGESMFCEGLALIGAAIPQTGDGPELAITLSGDAAELQARRAELADILLKTIRRTFDVETTRAVTMAPRCARGAA